jgi:hypothetical protein
MLNDQNTFILSYNNQILYFWYDYFFKVLRFLFFGRFDSFLKNRNRVIHIGANLGQEIKHYENLGIQRVCWVEADPEIYKMLISNIKDYKIKKLIII